MPVSNDLDLPISYVPISGPAVDALDRRKENNSNPRIAATELRQSFNTVKDELFAGMAALAQAIVPSRHGRGPE
jgi:hypothetical protein